MNLQPHYISVIITAVILYALAFLGSMIAQKPIPAIVWYLIPLYGIVTALLFRMIRSSLRKNPTRFVTSVYATVLIKLMLSMIIAGVYLFMGFPGRKAFVIAIMGIYASYTVVLIRSLLPLVRSGGPTPQ
ncbi:MAG TPA: hypothetical protein VIK71_08985 [Flavobacteriales bacterium]|jgi:hypothetical protein